ncbi:Fic family protein [Desulfogranum marinum]|uniref:Fic family protein n=1 Tax=Desulfogranum marinum TaxID=453220 RepID=UPI0019622D00|nr:Fic family protein [Desulfogranum marinum]MBM9514788.1 Fic family protein [Desulfogranum marinum]
MKEKIGAMEPLLPPENARNLNDLALDLVSKASSFAGMLNPIVAKSVGNLVRSMNCYYSNLIEGHDTHPHDIDRALAQDYSNEPAKRALQKEAAAHIAVQKMIDEGGAPTVNPLSSTYGRWIHKEFCDRMPEELLWSENPETGEKIKVVPGIHRDKTVRVGRHIPPHPENLEMFLKRFDEAYDERRLSKLQRITSVAASHHRYVWIHPFLDGNGRVVRLMSYAAFKNIDVGSELWSVARGLARRKEEYKSILQAADAPRQGDLDGRGTLSQKALVKFCEFFLETCIDQVEYMNNLLDFKVLSERMRIHVEEMVAMKELPKGSYALLREALLIGEFGRGKAQEITGFKDRAAREVLYALVKKGLLVSDTLRGPVRLGFPIDIVERWFPLLYPATIK